MSLVNYGCYGLNLVSPTQPPTLSTYSLVVAGM